MVTMNGSIIGTVPSMFKSVGVSGLTVAECITLNMGAPNNIVTTGVGSSIVLDVANGEFYINKTALGSTWVHLGSIS
jgi:hypothetical protein